MELQLLQSWILSLCLCLCHTFELDLPNSTRGVILHVGTHLDPVEPPTDNESIIVLAFEPILNTAARIPVVPRRFVIQAAIAEGPSRLQTMYIYDTTSDYPAAASSLSKAHTQLDSFGWARLSSRQIVPVVSLRLVLESIPGHLDVLFLLTDMQSYDLQGLRSAGKLIRRVHWIVSEVQINGFQHYRGVSNDLQLDWMPFMESNGFRMAHVHELPTYLINYFGDKLMAHQTRAHSICNSKPPKRRVGQDEIDVAWVRVGPGY